MNATELTIQKEKMHKLLCAANPDAVLLYCYIECGNDPANAAKELMLNDARLSCATATLRQLGLLEDRKSAPVLTGERPRYTEQDIVGAMNEDTDFRALYGEVQRVLGRTLNTEELKIVLGFVRYLGLPAEVISVLISYCRDRARQKGSLRNPSLRTIEKEAYFWAEQGIDTMEEAAAFIQRQNLRRSRLGTIMELLQIRGRNLTAGEERYAQSWIDMGFEDEAIHLAYERTCLNTGGLSWPYLNRILTRWHEAGLHSVAQIQSGDKGVAPKGASGGLGQAEMEAIAKVLGG